MKKILTCAIAVTLTISLFAPVSHAWRKSYYYQHHKHVEESKAEKLQQCQASCDEKYGADGKKCRKLPIEEKIKCREKGRSCRAKCWNEYR